MENDIIIIITLFLIGALCMEGLYRRKQNKKEQKQLRLKKIAELEEEYMKAPHIQFPELLHWKEGDTIKRYGDNYELIAISNEYIEENESNSRTFYSDIGWLDEPRRRGAFILRRGESDVIITAPLKDFNSMINLSLHSRKSLDIADGSKRYMQLIANFQHEYEQLMKEDEEANFLTE